MQIDIESVKPGLLLARLADLQPPQCELKGKWIEAMVYIMNEGWPLGVPSRYYYDVIREGYMDAGFDLSILAKAVRDSKRSIFIIRKEEV